MIDPVKEIRFIEANGLSFADDLFASDRDYLTHLLTAARMRIELLEAALQQIADYPASDHPASEAIPLTGMVVTARQALRDTGQTKEKS